MASVLYTHEDKNRGDIIRSEDWNSLGSEVNRLDAAKVNRAGDSITGDLTVRGRLGIGTTPEVPLHIAASGNDALRITNAGSERSLQAGVDRTGVWLQPGEAGSSLRINAAPGKDAFIVNGNGNVGIGTTAPQAPLHVAGGARLNGIAIGNAQFGALQFPRETIQLDPAGTLRINFGTDQRAVFGNNGSLAVTGGLQSSYLTITPSNNTDEGGELLLRGAGKWEDIRVDNYQGNLRIFTLAPGKQFQVQGGGSSITGSLLVGAGGVPVSALDVRGNITAQGNNVYVRAQDPGEGNKYIELRYDGGWGRIYTDGSNIFTNRMLRSDGGLQVGGNGSAFNMTNSGQLTISGDAGIGTASIHNPQGWSRTLDLLGSSSARLNVRSATNGVVTSFFSHSNWSGARGALGTESNHPLTFVTNYTHRMTLDTEGNLGIGTTAPAKKLDVRGDLLFNNNALIAAFDPKVTTNFDHIWHDDGTAGGAPGTWNFCSDNSYKAAGNSRIRGGHIYMGANQENYLAGTLKVAGAITGNLSSLNVNESFSATIRCADFLIGHSGRRGSPGRAIVDNGAVLYLNYAGDWSKTYVGGTVSHISSAKYKREIRDLDKGTAGKLLEQLNPVTYKLKKQEDDFLSFGFIAEDVPEGIATPDREAIVPNHIIAVLTSVVKEQQEKIHTLTARLDRLVGGV